MQEILYKMSNGIFQTMTKFMPTADSNNSGSSTTTDPWKDTKFSWIQNILDWVKPLLYAIMAIVGAAGAIYAIVLGVRLAKAEDTSKRDEAKKHLITVLIAVAVTIALVLFFNVLFIDYILPQMLNGYAPSSNNSTKNNPS